MSIIEKSVRCHSRESSVISEEGCDVIYKASEAKEGSRKSQRKMTQTDYMINNLFRMVENRD